jgi:hypothetical protein
MSTIVKPPPLPPPARPALVWVIAAYYLGSFILGLVSLATLRWGLALLSEKRRHFFESLTMLDHVTASAIYLLHLAAAIMFVLRRRSALYLCGVAFALDLAITAHECIGQDWIAGLGASGIITQLRMWAFDIAIILYAIHLVKKRSLR